jgi:hypothetical protein
MPFKDALPSLIRLGVELYHVGLLARKVTSYIGNELQSYTTDVALPPYECRWDSCRGEDVGEGQILCTEFAKKAVEKGDTNYWVSVVGRTVASMSWYLQVYLTGFFGSWGVKQISLFIMKLLPLTCGRRKLDLSM